MPSWLAEGSVDDDNAGAIAGGVFAGLVAAAVVVAIVVYVAMSVNKKKKAAVESPVPDRDLLYGRQSTSTSLGSSHNAPPAITMPDDVGVKSMSREGTVISISMARVSPAPEDEETWARPGSRGSTARTARMLQVRAMTPEDTIHEVQTESLT